MTQRRTNLFNSILFGTEVVFVLLPVTAMLFLIGVPIAAEQIFDSPTTNNVVIALIAFFAALATLSVWFVFIQTIRCIAVINRKYIVWWVFILIGFIISITAAFVPRNTSLEPYSEDWFFYDQLATFTFGIPLLIPVAHVLVLSLLRQRMLKAI